MFWVCVEGEKRAQHVQTAWGSGAGVQKPVYEPTNIDAKIRTRDANIDDIWYVLKKTDS